LDGNNSLTIQQANTQIILQTDRLERKVVGELVGVAFVSCNAVISEQLAVGSWKSEQ